MQPTTLICPHCFTSLRTSEEMAGRLVKCPKCSQQFLAGGARGRLSGSSSGGNWAIIMAFVVALLIVIGGGAAGIYFIMNSAQKNDQTQAQANNQTPPNNNPVSPPAGNNGQIDPTPPVNPNPGKPVEEPGKNNPVVEPKKPDPTPPEPKKPDPMPPEPKKPDPMPPEPKKPDPMPPMPPEPKKPDPTPPKIEPKLPGQVSKENQEKINKAIDKGVEFIKKTQNPDGSWTNPTGQVSLGYAALPALTLLECGVPPTDPVVQKATAFLRLHAANWSGAYTNYDITLTLLFLDKLGAKQDQELIRHTALRLIAGQRSDGGWDYSSPPLSNQEAFEFLGFLQATRPVPSMVTEDGKIIPINPPGNPKDKLAPLPKGQVEPIFKPFNTSLLSPNIQKLPVVKITPEPKSQGRKAELKKPANDTDNSNSQFAIMALWVARKYNIPVERSLALVDHRFISSQLPEGGWAYHYLHKNPTPSMTCVGLIGLAAGHGSHKESLGSAWLLAGGKSNQEDFAIQRGLSALAKSVGVAPTDWSQKVPLGNLYFIWSVERVSVLYNLKTIGGKDWYSWAAQMLVVHQSPDGCWSEGNYAAHSATINTCLALLTLKRANLVPDLTESLKEYIPIKDPGSK